MLSFRDTGVGINHETIVRIFDPFFTTKDIGEGTGMGLSVVHGIVKSHGGAIGVESTPGKGSSFKIFIPLIQDKLEKSNSAVEVIQTGNERVIIVDDDPALSKMMERLLESLGYSVTVTESPKLAYEKIKASPQEFDLLLTDQTMPEMAGNLLTKAVLKIRPGLPAIICTGYSDILDDQKARAMGVRALLMKPICKANLAETIRRVLNESD